MLLPATAVLVSHRFRSTGQAALVDNGGREPKPNPGQFLLVLRTRSDAFTAPGFNAVTTSRPNKAEYVPDYHEVTQPPWPCSAALSAI